MVEIQPLFSLSLLFLFSTVEIGCRIEFEKLIQTRPVGWIGGKATIDERKELRWEAASGVVEREELQGVAGASARLEWRLGMVGLPAGDSEREGVGGRVGRRAVRFCGEQALRSGEAAGADALEGSQLEGLVSGAHLVRHEGDAKVDQLGREGRALGFSEKHHVLWLDIVVEDIGRVQMMQSMGQSNHHCNQINIRNTM